MKSKNKLVKLIVVVSLLILGFFILYKLGSLEYLKDRKKIENLINSFGMLGPIIYIGLYVLVTISCLSPVPLGITSGVIFGPIMGIVYTMIGASIGLSLSFLIARYIAKNGIEKKFRKTIVFNKINEGVKKEDWFILATTRLLPIFPFGIQNYVYGLTSISFVKYSLLSTIFILPGTSVFILLAGAVSSGDIKTAIKMSIIASLIFFGLTIITKIVSKKYK
ncbi:MAG: TVP38/TMEM64 family protein [Cetobacterium sp.]